MENWKVIPSAPRYEVSDKGGVRNAQTKRPMRTSDNGRGYRILALRHDGQTRHRTVHSLVLEAFVGPRPPGMDVSHLNDVRDDNRLENLCYESRSDNIRRYRLRQGRTYPPYVPAPSLPVPQMDDSVPDFDQLPQ